MYDIQIVISRHSRDTVTRPIASLEPCTYGSVISTKMLTAKTAKIEIVNNDDKRALVPVAVGVSRVTFRPTIKILDAPTRLISSYLGEGNFDPST